MELGVIGLGRMGQIVVDRTLDAGHDVVAFDLSAEATAEAAEAGATAADSVDDLCDRLGAEKRIWLMVPAGDPVDAALDELAPHLDADGDQISPPPLARPALALSRRRHQLSPPGRAAGSRETVR